MIEFLKIKLQDWLKKRPPKIGPDTIRIIAEDARKGGLGLMAAGVFGLLQIAPKFTTAGAMMLFLVGFIFWAAAVMLHYINERAMPQNEE